jgi:hypothetical protein
MDASRFEVQRLDHLGLVAGFCKVIGLEELTNQRMPKESHNSMISNGTLLAAMILSFIAENQAGIPLYMQAVSGNANDSETFKKTVKSHLKSLKEAYHNTYFIADSALYAEETIQALAE